MGSPRVLRYVGIAALIVGSFVGLQAVKTAWTEYQDVRPPRRPVPDLPLAMVGAGRAVSFSTHDDVTIKGWFFPSRNGAAVALVHGYGGNRVDLMPEATLLVAQGYGVLALDSRAHGESGGDLDTYGDHERADITAALDFLSMQPDVQPGRIALLGFSSGTSQVALVGARDKRVAALVLEAPVSSLVDFCDDQNGRWDWLLTPVTVATMRYLGIDVEAVSLVRAISALSPRALLVVHGEADSIIPPARARQVFEAAGEPKQMLLVPNAGHGQYLSADEVLYSRVLVEFLRKHLLPSASPQSSTAATP